MIVFFFCQQQDHLICCPARPIQVNLKEFKSLSPPFLKRQTCQFNREISFIEKLYFVWNVESSEVSRVTADCGPQLPNNSETWAEFWVWALLLCLCYVVILTLIYILFPNILLVERAYLCFYNKESTKTLLLTGMLSKQISHWFSGQVFQF